MDQKDALNIAMQYTSTIESQYDVRIRGITKVINVKGELGKKYASKSKYGLTFNKTFQEACMPSAHEIGPDGWLKYKKKKYFSKDYHTISVSDQKKLIQKVSQAALILKKNFGATRVFVFGSLLDRTRYTSDSDIDIAVEGISHSDYWKAWRVVDNYLVDQYVDFIDINDLDERFRNNIINQGLPV